VRVRGSAVYVTDDRTSTTAASNSSYSVGGVVGFGPVSVGANYADSGDSGTTIANNEENSYWDVAVAYEAGPIYLSAGYFVGTEEIPAGDDEFTALSLTADYSVAPGLTAYVEYTMAEYESYTGVSSDGSVLIAGANVKF